MEGKKVKIVLTDNEELVQDIKAGLKASGGYCPCRVEHNEDTKCMCKEFREQESGVCHCGLYEKIILKEE